MESELKNIIKQIEKNKKRIATLKEKNKKLPKGTIFVRRIGNKAYIYRNKKSEGKVLCEYLGPFYSEQAQKELNKSKLYKRNVLQIRKLEKQLKAMSKDIRNKGKKDEENLVDFAININSVDGVMPSNKAQILLNLLDKGIIDLQTYEFALSRIYKRA